MHEHDKTDFAKIYHFKNNDKIQPKIIFCSEIVTIILAN